MAIFGNLRFLRDAIALVRRLADVTEPITTEAGLEARFEILLDGAELLGLPSEMRAKLQAALDEPHELQLALAVVRFAYAEWAPPSGSGGVEALSLHGAAMIADKVTGDPDTAGEHDAKAFLDWLPVVLQILTLIQELLDSRRAAA